MKWTVALVIALALSITASLGGMPPAWVFCMSLALTLFFYPSKSQPGENPAGAGVHQDGDTDGGSDPTASSTYGVADLRNDLRPLNDLPRRPIWNRLLGTD